MKISSTDLSSMLETAVVAARLAGQHAMEELYYTRKSLKSPDEIVTAADPACQKIIIDRIRENYPDHGFLAEEGKESKLLRMAPRDQEIWWVIDPIDGTNNFSNGLLCFCVSIAAFYEGKPILGVIYDPTTDSMYAAAAEREAQLNGRRIQVSEDAISRFTSFGVDSHQHPKTDKAILEIMQKTRFRCLGATALHMAYVAKGSLIGMATTSARLWDIAAGVILVEQAGGRVTDLDGQPIFPIDIETYDSEPLHTLATSAKVWEEIHRVFQSQGR